MEVPLARPDITEKEIAAVVEVLRTPYLSLGPKLEEFERRLAAYVGVKHGVATNSGTSALHLIIKALGISEGDEVITTPFSFIASANCILFERARPVFVDIDPRTLNIDPGRIEAAITPKTKAILAVDVFGQPADWDRLEGIARRHSLLLIEDSAEALGAEYKGRKAGSFGEAAVFGFYPNKQITTGEGGMILTDNDGLARLCRSLRNQGRGVARHEGQGWHQHERLGYNYRLSELNCALGLAQLERLEEILEKRERVAQMYNDRLRDIDGVESPYISPDVRMSWFVYVVRLSEEYSPEDRDRMLQGLKARGIGCSNYFPPIHLQPVYRELGYREGDFPVTERVAARTIALPFHNNLTEREVDYVVRSLKELLSGLR
ncbi:MAG: DegT/DnrJ/EryC1/StrS family aminotransferase [Candidatus Acetothermia bacterium]|jgi:perosamine synthetase|nr:DegT/DnrJ/EryC1/StrS family aminotransferase [Candidatus Acetothermia bacterium]MDH7505847.1 DegT/DnrJ/EryC1/StrS family aminotransferase [Candidatus Acetothermia bacterium]